MRPETIAWTARLWQRLTELDSGFAARYGLPEESNSAFQTWCICLKDLTPDQFKLGLERYEKSGNAFIGAVEFYRLAGGVLHKDGGHIPRPFKKPAWLLEHDGSKDIGRSILDELKRRFNGV